MMSLSTDQTEVGVYTIIAVSYMYTTVDSG